MSSLKLLFMLMALSMLSLASAATLSMPIWNSWEKPTGEYYLASQTGDERAYDVSINGKTICLNADSMVKSIPDESDLTGKTMKQVVIPSKIPLEINNIPLKTDLSFASKGSGGSFCYTANPLVDYTLKFGTQSIIIQQSTSTIVNATLINTTVESNGGAYAHLNVSDLSNLLYMPFDIEAMKTHDFTGYNNDGTMSLYTTSCPDTYCAWTTGQVGNALKFDGVNSYLSAGFYHIPQNGKNITWVFWAKRNDITGTEAIFGHTGGGGYCNPIDLGPTGTLSGTMGNNQNAYLISPSGITVTNWNNYVVTATSYNSTHANVSVYINGIYIGTNTSISTIDCQYVSIGRHGTNYFNGTLDEIRIWNRTLSSDEITNLYNNESQGYNEAGMNRTGLGIEYQLNYTTGRGTVFNTAGALNATTIYSRPQYNSTGGKYGGAYTFLGTKPIYSGDVINVPTMATNNLNFSGTVSLWAYTDTAQNYATMIEKRSLGGNGIYMQTEWASQMHLSIDYGPECGKWYGSANPIMLVTGRWQHYVMTWDNATRNMSVYINGSLIYNNNSCMIDQSSVGIGNNLQMTIGNRGLGADNQGWNGTIDEVMIFNRSLSADEVMTIYNSTFSRFKSQGTVQTINVNITQGYNKITVQAPTQQLNGSSVQVQLGYANPSNWSNISWTYTGYQQLGSIFTVPIDTMTILPVYLLTASPNYFYTSILGNSVNMTYEEFQIYTVKTIYPDMDNVPHVHLGQINQFGDKIPYVQLNKTLQFA